MRILLLHDSRPASSPGQVMTFLTQVVRQAQNAGHEIREWMPHDTEGDRGDHSFRALLRNWLDIEIRDFDPQIVHVHGLGVLGHLALESGAPYVVSVFANELSRPPGDTVWHQQTQEAIENAGYVIVDGDESRRAVEVRFGEVQGLAVATGMAATTTEAELSAQQLEWLWEVYQVVVARRSG